MLDVNLAPLLEQFMSFILLFRFLPVDREQKLHDRTFLIFKRVSKSPEKRLSFDRKRLEIWRLDGSVDLNCLLLVRSKILHDRLIDVSGKDVILLSNRVAAL